MKTWEQFFPIKALLQYNASGSNKTIIVPQQRNPGPACLGAFTNQRHITTKNARNGEATRASGYNFFRDLDVQNQERSKKHLFSTILR